MPKERFHLYLADELLRRCGDPASSRRFYIGAISPDIFFYDLPFFSLSPLGDALHDLVDRQGISLIYDWIAQTSSPPGASQSWGLGFACHFLIDAAWHPVINELSGSRRAKEAWCGEQGAGERQSDAGSPLLDSCRRCSKIECHRLLESELEALWLARYAAPQKYDDLLEDFRKDHDLLHEIASCYRRFLEFSGLSAEVSERRILKCFLHQNFLLRLFANKVLGKRRDLLLSFPPTRFLGALVMPLRPVLPALFSHALTEDRNPFSDRFMERAMTSLESHLCGRL